MALLVRVKYKIHDKLPSTAFMDHAYTLVVALNMNLSTLRILVLFNMNPTLGEFTLI